MKMATSERPLAIRLGARRDYAHTTGLEAGLQKEATDVAKWHAGFDATDAQRDGGEDHEPDGLE